MKTKHLLVVALFFITSEVYGQSFLFAKQAGGSGFDQANGVASDKAGNTYVTGYFNVTAYFDTANIVAMGTTTDDIFLAKYNPAGKLIWIKRAGNTSSDEGKAICVDSSGNVYITGYYNGNVDFGSFTLLNGNGGGFLAKYNSSGDVIWAKSLGNGLADEGDGLFADDRGFIYITGDFQNKEVLGNDTINSLGYQDIFVAKCDLDGNWLWAASIGDIKTDFSFSVCADSFGNAYITGSIMDIGNNQHCLIAKYNPVLSAWEWKKQFTAFSQGSDITLDSKNKIYVTGYFSSSVMNFDTITLNNLFPNTAEIFIAKLDSLGNTIWAQSYGGEGNDLTFSLKTNKNEDLFVTGAFETDLIIGNDSLYNPIGANVFVSKFQKNGVPLWTVYAGGTEAYPTSLCLDPIGNPVIVGYFAFGDTIGSAFFNSYGGNDIFIMKMSDNTLSGIEETTSEKQFTFYPNPASTTLNIQLSETVIEKISFQIYDVVGREIFSQTEIKNPKSEINIAILQSGIYFLQIRTDNEIIVKKFAKE